MTITGSSSSHGERPREVFDKSLEETAFPRVVYRSTSFMMKRPAPWDHPRSQDISLRWGPTGMRCVVSDVLLWVLALRQLLESWGGRDEREERVSERRRRGIL